MCKTDRQKIKDYQKQYRENMTDRDRDRYNKINDEEKQKHRKNIKTCQKSKNKKEEIIKNNI